MASPMGVRVCMCMCMSLNEQNLGCVLSFQKTALYLDCCQVIHFSIVLFWALMEGEGLVRRGVWRLILCLYFIHPLTHDSLLCTEMFGHGR